MPYNNTPIAPSQEVTGTVSLPLARVKKIVAADEDVSACSNNAAFTIALATEMFIQHLAEQTHIVVKTERKPRRNIQYRDVANAVARIDNLEFLADVVPRTMTYKKFKEQKVEKEKSGKEVKNGDEGMKSGAEGALRNGNGVVESVDGVEGEERNGHQESVRRPEEVEAEIDKMEVDEEHVHARDDDPAAMQLEMEMRGPGPRVNGNGSLDRPSGGFTSINGLP